MRGHGHVDHGNFGLSIPLGRRMTVTPEPLRILLVADDPEQIRRTGQGLQRQGSGRIVLEGADSLTTARRRLSAGAYDLAILDLALGEGPGLDVLEDFRIVAPDVPVVVFARPGTPGDLAGSLALGAADCLSVDALDCAGLADRLQAAAVRKGAEGRDLRRQRHLKAALEGAGDLVWHWEPGSPVWLSAPDPVAWGLSDREAGESVESLRGRVHPDDRERVRQQVEDALAGEGAWRVEARVRLGGGGYRWCECRGRVWRDASGVLESVAGTVTDVQRQYNAVRELERGRRQLQAVLDSDPVASAVINASGFVTDCNKAWMALDEAGCHAGPRFGPGTSFVPEKDESQTHDGPSRKELEHGLKQVLTGTAGSFTCEYGTLDRRWRIRIFPLLNPGIAGAVIRHEEANAGGRAAARPASRPAGLETSLAALPCPAFRLDANFVVREMNRAARALCSREPEGWDVLKALRRTDADAVAAALAETAKSPAAAWHDSTGRGGEPRRRWGAKALPGTDGPQGFLLIAFEVSDLLAEEAGMEAARAAAMGSPVGIAILEGRGEAATIQWANPAFAAMSGKPADAVVGRRLEDHLAGAGRCDAGELARSVDGTVPGSRLTIHRYDGAAWELEFASLGKRVCVTAADVADRERTVNALAELRRRLQGALRGSGDGAWEWDAASGRGWLSPRGLEVLGLPADAPGDQFDAAIERVHRRDRARLKNAIEEAAHSGGGLETEFRLEGRDGTWIEIRGQGSRGSRVIAGTLRDITEVRRARQALEEREEHATLAVRGASLGTWSWAPGSGAVHVDARARHLHGDEAEAGRVGLRDWLRRVAPADRRAVLEAVARAGDEGALRIRYRLASGDRAVAVDGQVIGAGDPGRQRADGVCRDVTDEANQRQAALTASRHLESTLAFLPGMVARAAGDGTLVWTNAAWRAAFPEARTLAEAISPEQCVELEPRLRSVRGGEAFHGPLVLPVAGQPRHVEAFWAPVGEHGEFLVVLHDLTEDREADSRLFQVRKMEAVGQLAGGVAHEFNNLLGVIVGSLELLEGQTGVEPAGARRLAAALGAARQGADVARRLMAFARQQDLEPEPVDVSSFARTRAELLGRLLGEGGMLELDLADEPWEVDVDPAHLETALVHLVRNAAQAMDGGGRVTLSTRNRALAEGEARRRLGPSAEGGDYVEVAVLDTGAGIPEEVLARVFDPFFTTRGAGRAAGLGLSLVWGFAQQSGGRAIIESTQGEGTRVALLLPRRGDSAPVARARAQHPEPAAVRGAIVVEPDPALRETASDLLASLGWDVRAVGDAPAALQALAEAPADLLFTETSPGGDMDGVTLARRAMANQPSLKVLFSESRSAPAGEAAHPFVAKPYGRRELEAALREAMEDEQAHG